MKKTEFDGRVAFSWEPDEQDMRRDFESAIAERESINTLAEALVRAMEHATARRQAAWADIAAKIEKDTGYDLGRQMLDYSSFKRLFVVLPNPQDKKVIRPAGPADVPPMNPNIKLH